MTLKIVPLVISAVFVLLINSAESNDCVAGSNCFNDTTATASPQNNDTEVTTHAAKASEKPKLSDMLMEDGHSDAVLHLPTQVNDTTNNVSGLEEPKGRSLNFTFDEHHNHENGLLSNETAAAHDEFGDLSDVSMDNDSEDVNPKILSFKEPAAKHVFNNISLGICEKGGLTYENGEKLENGCDSICTCMNGKMDCTDRCLKPFIRKGKKLDDPLCTAKDVEDPCCAILVCADDTETEPLEMCTYGNKTYNRGEKIMKDCEEVCTCEAGGKMACKSRCAPVKKAGDRCVEVQDPNDACCKTVLCDVTIEDHDDDIPKIKIISAKYINSTTIRLKFESKLDENQTSPQIEVSEDKVSWKPYKLLPGGLLEGFKTNIKYLRIENTDDVIDIQNSDLYSKGKEDNKGCVYKGEARKIGEEFHDECNALCVCQESGVKCLKIECPTYFGVDVLDPNCVEWETDPPDFKATPPNCCPTNLRCKNNGSCVYKGETYANWKHLPTNVTGCEKSCYCENGNVECQNICPPVTALPPANLPCPSHHVMLDHLPDDDCCLYWTCNPSAMNHGLNETRTENINETDKYLIPTKAPSKVLGPLLVYANNETSTPNNNTTLNNNPFYHKLNADNKIPNDVNPNILPTANKPKISPPYLGPLNPNFNKKVIEPQVSKQKGKNKTNGLFVTPPTVVDKPEVPIPQPQYPKPNIQIPDRGTQIQIHAQGNPEDILQIINQHPEITNYPHGSVLEIHNVKQPQYLNPNTIGAQQPQVPYLIHQEQPQLPPGVTLEQLLQEIHKPPQNANPYLNFPPHTNNGQIFVAPQSGPVIPTRPNIPNKGGQIFPGVFQNVPGYQTSSDEVMVHNLEAVDSRTVKLAFSVPPVIVGLHGRVEVRYTDRPNNDQNDWELQVFAPPNDLIATPQLEFDLLGLQPDTEYKIKITITLRDLHNTPSSRVYSIRTPKETLASTLPPMIPIEPEMAISEINATWANVVWRKFTDYELQFIDGVQLRYKEIDGKIYAATPLIHRAVTSYTLENLKPNTKYEMGIFFIPFPGQTTELHAGNILHFTTANEVDTYGFNVTLEVAQIKASTVEIMWSGVPYPEDKYVNIYRAVYQSESGKEDFSSFKIAKRDSPSKTMIKDLKPGTRYMLWLEVYLTNGKIKTSNVQDFITKPRSAPALGASTHQDKLAAGEYIDHKGDYYGPLVIVAILAAIAIMSTLILLLILVRRHSQNKASITPPTRISQSAYDNPTYKVEIQQETMGL